MLVGLLLALSVRAANAEPASNWVSYDYTGKLQYKTDATGAKLLDYSLSGYQGGTQNIPLVPVVLTLSPRGNEQGTTGTTFYSTATTSYDVRLTQADLSCVMQFGHKFLLRANTRNRLAV